VKIGDCEVYNRRIPVSMLDSMTRPVWAARIFPLMESPA